MLGKTFAVSFLRLFSTNIKDSSQMLSEIDAKFGDGDHGVTMNKIGNTISDVLDNSDSLSTKEVFATIASKISSLGGGAAVPLWGLFFEGLSKPIEGDDLSFATIQKMFASAVEEIGVISTAKVGDKTMMDALIPVCEYLSKEDSSSTDLKAIFKTASDVSKEGSENTKNYMAKFGRAKTAKEQSIGTPDAGSISMSIFFNSFYEAI